MAQALQDKAAAERERKANIRRGKERLAALDAEAQATVQAEAARLEAADGGKKAGWRYLEQALDAHDAVPAAEVTIDLGDPASVAAGVDELAHGALESLRGKVRKARTDDGLTLAEIQARFNLHADLVRELLGDTPRGKAGKPKTGTARPKRPARPCRDHQGERQEKCPDCGQWRPAPLKPDGGYEPAADFRKGRSDCRACYNRRWREGNERRKAAK